MKNLEEFKSKYIDYFFENFLHVIITYNNTIENNELVIDQKAYEVNNLNSFGSICSNLAKAIDLKLPKFRNKLNVAYFN